MRRRGGVWSFEVDVTSHCVVHRPSHSAWPHRTEEERALHRPFALLRHRGMLGSWMAKESGISRVEAQTEEYAGAPAALIESL